MRRALFALVLPLAAALAAGAPCKAATRKFCKGVKPGKVGDAKAARRCERAEYAEACAACGQCKKTTTPKDRAVCEEARGKKSCKKVKRGEKDKKCEKSKYRDRCPACGVCGYCGDSKEWRYRETSEFDVGKKKCRHLAKKANKMVKKGKTYEKALKKACETVGVDGTRGRDACPDTCGAPLDAATCADHVPTPRPTTPRPTGPSKTCFDADGDGWPGAGCDQCGNQPLVWGVPTKLQNSLSRSNRRRFG